MITNWKTTATGIVALLGLAYNIYTKGGISVADFLTLTVGVGFILSKDSK